MSSAGGKALVLAQTERVGRRVVERLVRRGYAESDIVLVLREREDVPQCCVRGWSEYVSEDDRQAEVARVRAAVDSAAKRLREAFTVQGLSLYEAWRPEFFAFFLDDLVALGCVVREALRQELPSELHVAEDPAARSWWTGRERSAEVARASAEAAGVPVRATPGCAVRSIRDAVLRGGALVLSVGWAVGACIRGMSRRLGGRRVGSTSAGRRPRVLVAVFGASELDIVADLRRELHEAECGDVEVVDLGFEQTGRLARERGWDVGDLAAHTTARALLRTLCAPLSAWRAWRRVTRGEGWARSFSVSGVPLWPAAAPRGWATAMASLTRTIASGTVADELLRRADPDVVVCFKRGSCTPAGLVLGAQRHGIPTVYIQHGLLSETFRTQPSLPHTLFLVFSEHARDQIAASGVAEEAIEVVGHAGYDALAAGQLPNAAPEHLRALADGAEHVLLLLTQPDEGLRGLPGGRWIEHTFAAVVQIAGCRLIVKMHPRDTRAEAYAALATETGADARVVSHAEAKLPELWPLCGAVAMGYSTAAFEAIIFGKPVVSVNLTGEEDCYPFAASGAALAAREPNEVLPALRAALTDEQAREGLARRREEFIARHVGPLDGRAAERMAAMILDKARQRMADRPSATFRT